MDLRFGRPAGLVAGHWEGDWQRGDAVENDDDRPDRVPRSRLDTAGKRSRPHWNLFRGARPSTARARVERRERTLVDGIVSSEHPVDVICGGMYRACSTWQYEVVAHLIERHAGGQRLGYMTSDQYAAHLRRDASGTEQRTGAGRAVARGQVTRSGPIVRSRDGPRASRGRLRLSRRSRSRLFAHAQTGNDLRAVAPSGDDPPDSGQRSVLDGTARRARPAL